MIIIYFHCYLIYYIIYSKYDLIFFKYVIIVLNIIINRSIRDMINIAICDDNIHMCSEIENILLKYQKSLFNETYIVITCFS